MVQWEIALSMPEGTYLASVAPRPDEYLDSEGVVEAAAEAFSTDISEVYVVAKPGLHAWKCRRLVRQAGFTPLNPGIPLIERDRWRLRWGIGYLPGSSQWWTRGPLREFAYAIRQIPQVIHPRRT